VSPPGAWDGGGRCYSGYHSAPTLIARYGPRPPPFTRSPPPSQGLTSAEASAENKALFCPSQPSPAPSSRQTSARPASSPLRRSCQPRPPCTCLCFVAESCLRSQPLLYFRALSPASPAEPRTLVLEEENVRSVGPKACPETTRGGRGAGPSRWLAWHTRFGCTDGVAATHVLEALRGIFAQPMSHLALTILFPYYLFPQIPRLASPL
jgi:hypothetical protein